MKSKCLTINTDASWCPHTKGGGFAFWAKCDQFTVKESGGFQHLSGDPTEAEIKAIGNAINQMLKRKELPVVEYLILNTDSTSAISRIGTPANEGDKFVWRLWTKLIFRTQAQKAEFRHVKAHTAKQDARSIVNDWCDKEAKRHMRKQRSAINKYNRENEQKN